MKGKLLKGIEIGFTYDQTVAYVVNVYQQCLIIYIP